MRTSTASQSAAAAWADGPDAPGRAVRGAVGQVAGPPALVLLFADPALAGDEALARAGEAAEGCPVAGLTHDGLIAEGGLRSGGCWALALGAGFAAGVGLACEASLNLRAAGRAAARAALDAVSPQPGRGVVLLFVDPASGDEGEAVDGAYEAVGAHLPLAGGGTNGSPQHLFADGRVCADAVVAVAVASDAPVGIGIAHGCRPGAVPAIVTRSEGGNIRELDGRPADHVYLEGLGIQDTELDDDAFERLAVLHPLGQPQLRGSLRLRHVRGRAPGGGLACVTHLPPNAPVWLTEQTEQTIIESAQAAARDALRALPGPPRAALAFDCAARRRALGERLDEEARAVCAALHEVPAVGALYTRGEVGRIRGAKGDLNHAIVVVAFA